MFRKLWLVLNSKKADYAIAFALIFFSIPLLPTVYVAYTSEVPPKNIGEDLAIFYMLIVLGAISLLLTWLRPK